MESTVTIRKKTDTTYSVRVHDSEKSVSAHEVRIDPMYLKKLGWRHTESSIEKLLHQSFYFLLEREPKEAILTHFALSDIADYFPDYEDEIRRG